MPGKEIAKAVIHICLSRALSRALSFAHMTIRAIRTMRWTREDTKNHLKLSPIVWIDATTRQPLEHSIKLDIKMKGLMETRRMRAAHPRQGLFFRETGAMSAQAAGQHLRQRYPRNCASTPLPRVLNDPQISTVYSPEPPIHLPPCKRMEAKLGCTHYVP